MIRKLDGMPEGVLGFEAVGKLTAADYTTVLEPELEAATKAGDKVRVVFALTGDFDGMEPSAMWQDLKTGIRDWNTWERIALVTNHTWMKDGLKLFAWAVPGEVKAFDADQLDQAVSWASAP